MNPVEDALREVAALAEEKRAAEAMVSEIAGRYEAAKALLIARADEAGVKQLPTLSGVPRVSLGVRQSVKCTDPAALRRWVTEAGYEALLTVHSNTLSSHVASLVEAGATVPAFLEVTPIRTVSVGKVAQ